MYDLNIYYYDTTALLLGLWDCVFGTRKTGRHPGAAETPRDKKMAETDQKTARYCVSSAGNF